MPNTSSTTTTFNAMRKQIGEWLKGPEGARLWDLLCCLRGPDSPSERPDMSSTDSSRAYAGRRARKFKTVEIIRAAAFYGVIGGAARSHSDTKVTLPPASQWDHFDKHVSRAASVLGLEVEIEGETRERGTVDVQIKPAAKGENDIPF